MKIMPLLFGGVLVAGFYLGPGHEGIIPSQWVSSLVGGTTGSKLFASIAEHLCILPH